MTALIIVSILLSLASYNYLPDTIPSHWNINSEVDAYSGKLMPSILFPSILILFYLLVVYLPRIDPLSKNIKRFEKEFHNFILILMLFFISLQIFITFTGLGYELKISYLMIPGLSVLFYYISVLFQNSKRNWFIGIRTPWTLSSDAVWDKTHKVGAKMFKLIAFVNLAGLWFQGKSLVITVSLAVFSAIYLIIYSYLEYKKI